MKTNGFQSRRQRVLVENQINKNRKGSKRADRFLGPHEIIEISDACNCTLKHEEGQIKKRKHPLAHLKMYNERNLVIESDSEEVEERNRKVTNVETEGLLDMDNLLEHFDKEEVKTGREEKEEKKNEKEEVLVQQGKRSFAEEFLGLTKNPKYEDPVKKREGNCIHKRVKLRRG